MKTIAAALACVLLFAGCKSNPQKDAAVRGALIGAAGGAAVSMITGGDIATGAAVGAAGGAAIGAITADGKKRDLRRDAYGREYWVDDRGRWNYVQPGRR